MLLPLQPCRAEQAHKKTGVAERSQAFHHAGLLFNEPLGSSLRTGRAALYLVIRQTRFTGLAELQQAIAAPGQHPRSYPAAVPKQAPVLNIRGIWCLIVVVDPYQNSAADTLASRHEDAGRNRSRHLRRDVAIRAGIHGPRAQGHPRAPDRRPVGGPTAGRFDRRRAAPGEDAPAREGTRSAQASPDPAHRNGAAGPGSRWFRRSPASMSSACITTSAPSPAKRSCCSPWTRRPCSAIPKNARAVRPWPVAAHNVGSACRAEPVGRKDVAAPTGGSRRDHGPHPADFSNDLNWQPQRVRPHRLAAAHARHFLRLTAAGVGGRGSCGPTGQPSSAQGIALGWQPPTIFEP